MKATGRRSVLVNGAFRSQRLTGQQRYATEVANRLIAAGVGQVEPGRFWSASAARCWFWTIFVLPIRARKAVLISLTSRAPIFHRHHIVAVHDLFVVTNPEWYSRAYVLTHRPMLWLQLRTSASALVVSEPVGRQLSSVVRRAGWSVVLAPNAPSELFADVVPSNVLHEYGLSRGRYLLTVGSQDPRKNLEGLAAAWSALSAEERRLRPLVVVGGSSGSFAKIAAAWPQEAVILGYVTDGDLATLYRNAQAIVFVSFAEGFGLPIVEAAAAGAERFVLSDIEVFRWIAGDGPIYVDPRSKTAISAALSEVATAGAGELAKIDTGRFDWTRTAASVLGLARSLAK